MTCDAGKTEVAPSYGELETRLESERAAREAATDRAIEMERQRNQLRVDLAAEKSAHEETRKRLDCAEELAVAARIERDAASSRLAAAEEAMRAQEEWEKAEDAHEDICAYASCEFRGCPHDEVWAMREHAKVLRRAFLAGGKPK